MVKSKEMVSKGNHNVAPTQGYTEPTLGQVMVSPGIYPIEAMRYGIDKD